MIVVFPVVSIWGNLLVFDVCGLEVCTPFNDATMLPFTFCKMLARSLVACIVHTL